MINGCICDFKQLLVEVEVDVLGVLEIIQRDNALLDCILLIRNSSEETQTFFQHANGRFSAKAGFFLLCICSINEFTAALRALLMGEESGIREVLDKTEHIFHLLEFTVESKAHLKVRGKSVLRQDKTTH